MECSFCILLAKSNKAWSSEEIDVSLKTPEDPLLRQNLPSIVSKTNSLKINSPLPVGLKMGIDVAQIPSWRHWVSYHHSGIEYHQSLHF